MLMSHAWESEGKLSMRLLFICQIQILRQILRQGALSGKTTMRLLRRAVGGVADHPLQVVYQSTEIIPP